jgi:hypothetical protein
LVRNDRAIRRAARSGQGLANKSASQQQMVARYPQQLALFSRALNRSFTQGQKFNHWKCSFLVDDKRMKSCLTNQTPA